jgi:hypothetical protein
MPEAYAGRRNYVLSRTLKKAASPKVANINQDVTSFAQRLPAEKGKDIWLVRGASSPQHPVETAGEQDVSRRRPYAALCRPQLMFKHYERVRKRNAAGE